MSYDPRRDQIAKLSFDEERLWSAIALVAQLQAVCQHKQVDEYPFVIDGQRGFMRQCRDCGRFNP